MTYPEAAFCQKGEYYALEKDRLRFGDLSNDDLYSIMFSLESNSSGREAAKLPATVEGKVAEKAGIYIVRMTLYDPDFNPALQTEGRFEDGFWLDVREKIFINEATENSSKYKPEEAFIASYSDPLENELQSIVALENLVSTA